MDSLAGGLRLLLSKQPEEIRAGAAAVRAAADGRNARALEHAAVLAGAGIGEPQDWARSLTLLRQAAGCGSESARGQLEVLGGERFDFRAWTTPPAKQSLSDAPRIRRFEGFLDTATCAWLMQRAQGRLRPAQVYDAQSGQPAPEPGRTNFETDFDIVAADVVLLLVRAKIAVATGLPVAVMELTKILHYDTGQRFAPHFDFLDPEIPGFAAELAARGQRIATFLVYLNDGYEAGETDFPLLGLRHRGCAGDALLFANVDKASQPDRRTLHAGLPPARGEKWLLSQWIRDRTPA